MANLILNKVIMKYIHNFILAIVVLTTVSCKKFLDTKPEDFYSTNNYYETEEQLRAALNGIYSNMMNGRMYGALIPSYFTCVTDEMLTNRSLAQDNRGMYYVTQTPGYPYIADLWRYNYIGINLANNLLANIDKPTMNSTKRGYIKGETLFLRALNYYLLTTHFGEVPVVLRNAGINDTYMPAPSQSMIYQQIETDLKEAEILLAGRTSASLGYNDVVTVTAVQAMLARVYLSWASYPIKETSKYDDAIVYADKVINSGLHDLNPDYRQVFINLFQDKYDVKENILEWGSVGAAAGVTTKTGNGVGDLAGITSVYNTLYPSSYSAASWFYITKKLFDSYETVPTSQLSFKTSLDIRRDWNCADFTYTYALVNGAEKRTSVPVTNVWQFRCGKFRREYAPQEQRLNGIYGTNWPVIRFSEVLLIKAEAEILKSSPDLNAAKELIERVRQRGYGTKYGNIIKDINVIAKGTGYSATNPPTVTITGGGAGNNPTAVAIVSSAGNVTGIRLTDKGTLSASGTYYTSAPTVTIAAPTSGTTATATATITNGTEHLLTPAYIAEQGGLLEVLKAERMRELCFEGYRRYDITRWGNFYADIQTFRAYAMANGGSGNANGMTALTGVDKKNELLPKPTYELNLNKALKQNKGY